MTPYSLTAADEFVVMMIAVTLSIDVPDQSHLLIWLTMGCEKTAAIYILVEQGITTTKHHKQRTQR